MQGKRKKYDPELSRKNDPRSKKEAVAFLKQMYPGTIVAEYDEAKNRFRHLFDAYVLDQRTSPATMRCFNVKRKVEWCKDGDEYNAVTGWPFKYGDIHFEERVCHDHVVGFIMMNNDYTRLYMVCKREVIESPLRPKSNKFVSDGEYFYNVDLATTKGVFFQKTPEGIWKKTPRFQAPKSHAWLDNLEAGL